MSDAGLARAIRAAARPLTGASDDHDGLLDSIGDARIVLLGEASHGTHEFYLERARLTRRLIEERGFNAVAVEGDWPDCLRVNRWVGGAGERTADIEALSDFGRFPAWMWRNTVVLDFIGWLRDRNALTNVGMAGFFGLDLYSLHGSIRAVVGYLDAVDPEAAARARERYSCFEHYGDDPQDYGYGAGQGLGSCEDDVVAALLELQRKAGEYAGRDGRAAQDEYFFAERNARLVENAEAYYRAMFRGRVNTWNLRDRHMFETLEALLAHLERTRGQAKVVVWAHNSHLGDARATYMARVGELNLGQLVRERFGNGSFSVGFTTHVGTVTAASDWGGPHEVKEVRPSLAGSYERLFHEAAGGGPANFWLDLRDPSKAVSGLRQERLERAIGVIYRPRTERHSHYFECRLPEQFDAVVHLDQTSALTPLDRTEGWERGELPDTYPSGV